MSPAHALWQAQQTAYGEWLMAHQPQDRDLQRLLNRFAARRDAPLVLTGSVDGALSGAVAHWSTSYRKSHAEVPVFRHHFGSSRAGRRPEVFVRHLLDWLRATVGLQEPVPAAPADALAVLPNWLARLAAQRRAVLVLDGLDSAEGQTDEGGPEWLPAFIPEPIRLVLTSRPGPQAEALRQRGWQLQEVDVPANSRVGDHLAQLPVGQADAVCALWVARHGLSDLDLRGLGFDPAIPDGLAYRCQGRLCLAGAEVQDAAARRLMPDGMDRQAWHALLARHLAAPDEDADVLDERVWQLVEAADWIALAELLTDPPRLALLLEPERRPGLLAAWSAWGADERLVDYYRQVVADWTSLPDNDAGTLLLGLALALRELGLEDGLEPLFQTAVQRSPSPAVWSAFGGWLLDRQRADEAEPLLRLALDTLGGPGGDGSQLRAARHRLAMALEQLDRLDEAEVLYQQALKSREAGLGEGHVGLLPYLNNLAAVRKARDDFEGARPLYQRALRLAERHYGQRHPTTAACLDNLAGLLYAGNDLEGAEDLYQRALGVAEVAFGPVHPATAASAHNLGAVMDAREQFQAAESLFRRAVEIREQVLGAEHMDTTSSLHNLAAALDAMGRYTQAEPLYRRALETWEKLVGHEHPATATTMNNLADLLREQGEWDEAEAMYRRNLGTWARLLGEQHPHVIMTRSELAGLYADKGDGAQAEPLLRQALQETLDIMGGAHPQHIACVTRLAALLRDSGRRDEAAELLQQALQRAEGTLGMLAPAVQKLRRHLDVVQAGSDRLH